MNKIDETANIGENVVIGVNNIIGPNVIISGNVEIGSNNYIGPSCYISNNVLVGNSNKFIGFVSVGSIGEMGSKGDKLLEDGTVEIGNNNTFREFITINSPFRRQKTKIGHSCYFMARSHVPHDTCIGNFVVMATNSLVGGGCEVSDYAYIGLNAHVHQWLNIGEGAMLGMGSVSVKHIPPFCIVVGVPSKVTGVNRIGLERRNIDLDLISDLDENYNKCINGQYNGSNPLLKIVMDFIQSNETMVKS